MDDRYTEKLCTNHCRLEGAGAEQGCTLVRQSDCSKEIAERLDAKKACLYHVDCYILTEESARIQEEMTNTLLRELPTLEQNTFSALCKKLHEGLEDIAASLSRVTSSDALKPVTNVPEPVKHFQQTKDATEVGQALENNPSLTIVSGARKSGKTQIGQYIASQLLQHLPTAVVCELNGQNHQTLLASKKELLTALNAEVPEEDDMAKVDECLDKALQNRGTPVLLIVDDHEDTALLTQQTPTILRKRIQSRVLVLPHEKDLQLPAKVDIQDTTHISVSGFSTEEVEMLQHTNKEVNVQTSKQLQQDKPDKPANQTEFLLTLNKATNHLPLTWASIHQYIAISHTSLRDYVVQLREGKALVDIQKKRQFLSRWMHPQYEKFDPIELQESKQLTTAIAKLSSTSKETTTSDACASFTYGEHYPASETSPSQPNNSEDSAVPKLENRKESNEKNLHFQATVVAAELTVEEKCNEDEEDDGTAQEVNMKANLGLTSAQCKEVMPCCQMTLLGHQIPDAPISAPNSVVQETLSDQPPIPSRLDGLQTTDAILSTEHKFEKTPQERMGVDPENLSRQMSIEREHGIVAEDESLPVEEPRSDSYEASMDLKTFGASTTAVNTLSSQSSSPATSQVKQCSSGHAPTPEMDSASSEVVAQTMPSSGGDPVDMAAENIDDSTLPKGQLPTASFEGGIEVEGAVGGRCSPYPAQTISQDQTTPICRSGRPSNVPCAEVQNVRRSLTSIWDQHREGIARRIEARLAGRFLVNANVLTEDEFKVIDAEETDIERATILLNILSFKDENALLEFCAALADQGCEDIAALITGSQVSNILIPVTNVPKPVNNFLPTRDANDVHKAVKDHHITTVSEMTGSGKTQILRWVASQFLLHHPTAVVWVLDGQNHQTLLASKKELLTALNAEVPEEDDMAKVDECLDKALQNRGTPVLLIVDDLEDAALLTLTFLRQRIQCRVLILTQEDLQLPDGTPFPCNLRGGFQIGEAERFFQIVFSQRILTEPDFQIEIDHLQVLTEVFDGRPLGLAAAFRYMRDTHTSPEHYMLMLKEDPSAMILQQEAERSMAQHYNKFDQRSLHPVFQAAQNNLRAPRDTPKTIEDTEETALETSSEDVSATCIIQEEEDEAAVSHALDDQDTEPVDTVLTASSGNSHLLASSGTSEEEGSELEGAVGGISSPSRSWASSPTGSLRAVASSPPPGFHHSRHAVQQHIEEDMSPYGPPALTVLENQELPIMPMQSSDRFTLERLSGTVLVHSHASEQLIARERGQPQQFLWQVAGRVVREVFDIDLDIQLESRYTFRYYAPSRPPDSLPFVPVDATVGTGTTEVQAVAAPDSLRWAWRIALTQAGQDSQLFLEIRDAGGNQRMAIFVEPAGPNLDHMPCRNPSLQQSSSSIVVSLEAERERLQMLIGQGSIAVRVQRGDGAQIIQEIVSLYLQTPSAAGCRLNVQFAGESAIDYGGPGRELFMLAWRWLSERCLENGIPCQSPDLEPSSYGFWLAIGRFTLHMFVMYNCFPFHLARYLVDALFNGPQQFECVNWLTAFLDTLPANIRILLYESCFNEAAFERNRVQLTAMLMTWGVSTFPRSPAHLLRMVPGIGRHVCLDSHYVALRGFVNGFREGWRGRVRPGDIDRLINQARHPTSYQDIIQALRIDSSCVDSHTGSRMRGFLIQWLQNATPAELQQLLITATGCDQLTGNVITIVFDPNNQENVISTCTRTFSMPVVETYEAFCTSMTGVLSDNTFNTV